MNDVIEVFVGERVSPKHEHHGAVAVRVNVG